MKSRLVSFVAVLIGLVGGVMVLPASAAITPAPSAPTTSSSGLSITPRKDLHVSPGKTVTDKLIIGNLSGSADLNLSLKVVDFTFTDTSGTPKLLLNDNAPQTSWSVKPFINLPKSVAVKAGQQVTVNYSVKVPSNQGAGSYYSAIEYIANGANGGNVSLNASGVTLVFVTIPGEVNESMTLQKFGAYKYDKSGASGKFLFISTSGEPDRLAFTLKNQGNVAEAPSGSITLKNIFGKQVATISNANPNAQLALIGQTRLFAPCIKSKEATVKFNGEATKTVDCANPQLRPGRYTASMDVLYAQNGNQSQEITATASFWYLPWWFLIAVLVILLIIAGGIWWLYRKVTNRGRSKASGRRFRR